MRTSPLSSQAITKVQEWMGRCLQRRGVDTTGVTEYQNVPWYGPELYEPYLKGIKQLLVVGGFQAVHAFFLTCDIVDAQKVCLNLSFPRGSVNLIQ